VANTASNNVRSASGEPAIIFYHTNILIIPEENFVKIKKMPRKMSQQHFCLRFFFIKTQFSMCF
jgi:hypothetical protein